MRSSFKFIGLLLLLLLGAQAEPGEKPIDVPDVIQKIQVNARVLDSFSPIARPNGDILEWVGGLDLSSTVKGFGGFSGLSISSSGSSLLAVSDAGVWMKLELETAPFVSDALDGLPLETGQAGDRPVGVKSAELAPLKGLNGKSLAGFSVGDAESVAFSNGDAVIGFEGTDVVWRYPYGKNGLAAVPHPVSIPDDIKRLRMTRGLEALAVFPAGSHYAGALLAIGESPVRGEDNLRAWIIDGASFRRLTVIPHDGFQVTDAAFLEDGTLLMLERRFLPPLGINARIRRIAADQISGGARLDGELIFEARLGAPIDNMEGMAVHKGADGAQYVTLISDDNFNVFQRTLLLRFRIKKKF